MHAFLPLQSHVHYRADRPAHLPFGTRSPHLLFTSSPLHSLHLFTSSFSPPLHLFTSSFSLPLHLFTSASLGLPHLPGVIPELCRASAIIPPDIVIEFRCVVTVSTPAVWLARENIKRLTPGPCINVEYSHGVVYMEETTSVFHSGQYGRPSIPIIYIPNPFYQMTVPVSMCPSNLNSMVSPDFSFDPTSTPC